MNPWSVVEEFEKVVADYGGSPYGVAVDSCTNALLLCCKYLSVDKVQLPCRTYVGVAQSVINGGGSVVFLPYTWQGCYRLTPYPIYDSARRFRRNMIHETEIWQQNQDKFYTPGNTEMGYYYCLSFHASKHIPIGRGGMILTNDSEFNDWCRKARFDGRTERVPPREDTFSWGIHCLMEPEHALRGLRLMENVKDYYPDLPNSEYADLSLQPIFGGKDVRDNP